MKINRASVFYTASILGTSSIIMQIIGFIYRIFLTNMAGTQALGVYKLTIQLYSVLLTVSTAGVCLVATNKSATYFAINQKAKLKNMIKACFLIFIGIFLMCSTVVILFPDFISEKILGDSRTKDALYILLLCILLTGFENIMKNSLIGIKKVKYTTFSELIEQILRSFIVLFLIHKFSDGNYGKIAFLIVLGMTISEIFSIIFLGACYKKIYKTEQKCKENMLVDVAKIAIPISLAAAINNIISSSSTVILPSRLVLAGFTQNQALSELGIISGVAMPIIIFPIAIISSYAIVIMPNISKSMVKSQYLNIERKIHKSFKATGFIGIPATMGLVFLSKPLGRILFSIEFPKYYMALIGISVVFLYYQIISASILNGLGFERKTVFHSVIGEFLQLVCTFLLCSIPQLNIYGYIIGMIVSPVIVSILNITYIFENKKFDYIEFIVKPLFCGVFLYITMQNCYDIILVSIGSQKISVILTSIIGLFSYLIILRCFGIKYFQYIKNLTINENYKFSINSKK